MPIPLQLQSILSLSDLWLTPIYAVILFFIVKKLKRKYYLNSPLGAFIFPAFFFHIGACIFFALIYQYYYGYGDMFGYFTGVREIWNASLKNPRLGLEILFTSRDSYSELVNTIAPYSSYLGFATATSVVIRIAGFFGLFCFASYLPLALIFGLFSFWGTWLMYVTINKYFPHLYKYIALACLFIPSVIVWSSGVGKEAPCMFALGLCFYSFHKIIHHERIIRHVVYITIGSLVLLYIKNYLFYTFAVAAITWLLSSFVGSIQNFVIRFLIQLLVLFCILIFFIYFLEPIQNSFKDGLVKGQNLQELMTSINDLSGGSGYTLPPFELTPVGIFESFFLSVNVTLFRPYLWECTNPLMLMSFLESFATLLLVVVVLLKAGIRKGIHYFKKYPVLVFMTAFSLILAPIVGFISFNFGTLVRYKIPLLPFLVSFLIIILLDKPGNNSKAGAASVTVS